MKQVSKATIKDNETEYKGCHFLEPRDWLDNAIQGKCINTGGIIYDYDLLLQCYMQRDNISKSQATQIVEWQTSNINKLTVDNKPVIQYKEEDEEEWD